MYMLNEIECEINRDRNETQVCACNFPPPIQERLVAQRPQPEMLRSVENSSGV